MISFIVPYKEDNEERKSNLEFAKKYYSHLVPESEFILILQKDTETFFHKTRMYNEGAKKAKHNILCFLDCDTFVSSDSIHKSLTLAQEDNSVIVGYNGVAIYLTFKAKGELDKLTYEKLLAFLPEDFKPELNNSNDNYNVANTKAVGGCLIMNKQCFKDIGGYNPNFKNWGYEDTEIVKRACLLKKNVLSVNTKNPYLFHLPHDDDKAPRNAHAYYLDNEAEYYKITSMSHKEIKEYIKTWNL